MEQHLEHRIETPTTVTPRGVSLKRFRLLAKSPSAMIGVAILGFWIVMALFGPQIAPYDINASEVGADWKGPSAGHIMGTDGLGRDIFSRLIIAAQPTRGLDIGATAFVWTSLRAARDRGCAILLVSSDLDELFDISDRVAVMLSGRIAGEFSPPYDIGRVGATMTEARS